jgi:glycosyltransferase involved in cell wall biosynthesis
VVLVTNALIRGGVWRHVEDLGCELRRTGHAVAVGLDRNAEQLHEAARSAALPVHDLKRTIWWRGCIWHAHLHDTVDRALAAAVVARRAIGPTVVTEHLPRSHASDESLLPGPRRPLARQAKTAFKRIEFASADAVIAVSPSSADFLADRYGIRREKIDVVMNGVQPAKSPPPDKWRSGPVRVVSVGSLIHQKGHDVLAEAASCSKGGWQATVIGDGPLREPLSRLAARDGLPVTFPGWSDDASIALANADIACMPSRWESFPYAALEAMRAGLPVVGTVVDGLRDLIEPEISGLLVPSEDAQSLADALDHLSADHARRTRMGQAAYARASQFTVQRMGAETAAVYRRIQDGSRRGRG